jgi:hypothetical protein
MTNDYVTRAVSICFLRHKFNCVSTLYCNLNIIILPYPLRYSLGDIDSGDLGMELHNMVRLAMPPATAPDYYITHWASPGMPELLLNKNWSCRRDVEKKVKGWSVPAQGAGGNGKSKSNNSSNSKSNNTNTQRKNKISVPVPDFIDLFGRVDQRLKKIVMKQSFDPQMDAALNLCGYQFCFFHLNFLWRTISGAGLG